MLRALRLNPGRPDKVHFMSKEIRPGVVYQTHVTRNGKDYIISENRTTGEVGIFPGTVDGEIEDYREVEGSTGYSELGQAYAWLMMNR